MPLPWDLMLWMVSALENITWMDKFKDQVPVRNGVLSEFVQSLRPWSSLKQSQLLTAIFRKP